MLEKRSYRREDKMCASATGRRGKGRCKVLLLGVMAVIVAFLACSCDSTPEERGLTTVGISITEDKLLTHSWVDGIASYDYKAVCNSHTPAKGEVAEWTELFVDGSGNAPLGLMENGDWTFTVRAFNSHGTQLYEGSCRDFVSGDHLEVPIVLALRKTGEGTVSFNITGRCSGLDARLGVYWHSYDGRDAGSSTAFSTASDGDTDTFTGSVTLPENRYSIRVEVYTPSTDTVLATDITDILVLAGENIWINGVLDGQKDQGGALTPIPPKVPTGHIEVSGTLKSGKTVTATWVNDGTVSPDRLCWYLDGNEISSHTASVTFVLPSPGMHYLTATATKGTESYYDEYPLDLASSPIQATNGVIVYDRGASYGTYWFDEYKEHYRIDDEGNGWRYIVAQVIDTGAGTAGSPAWTLAKSSGALTGSTAASVGSGKTGTDALVASMGSSTGTYTYGGKTCRPAPAGVLTAGSEWVLPTKSDAPYIMTAMRKGELPSVKFWTCTQYSSGKAYLADPSANSTSATAMTTGAGLVVVKYI